MKDAELQKAIDFIHAYMHPTSDSEYEQKKRKYRDMAIQALEQQKEVEHQEIIISLKNLAEFWDDFVCAHYLVEEKDRISQDDLMDELGIAFQDRFPKEYNEYRRKVILGIEE